MKMALIGSGTTRRYGVVEGSVSLGFGFQLFKLAQWVISPVGLIRYRDRDYTIGGGKMGSVTKELYAAITGIQYGELPEPYGWRRIVP